MALLFELAAEFDKNKAAASEFAKHFSGLTYQLSGNRLSRINAYPRDIRRDSEGNYWCAVVPSGASITGRPDRIVENEEELTALGFFLYEHLRSAPAFRYAYVGYEAEEFRTF